MTEMIMGMPITVAIAPRPVSGSAALLCEPKASETRSADRLFVDPAGAASAAPDAARSDVHDLTETAAAEIVFAYLREIDQKYSPYKPESEVSRISSGEIPVDDASEEMKEILRLSEDTRRLTHGYFDVWFRGKFDPSGLVKGWALYRAAQKLDAAGFRNYCIDGAGDLEVRGTNGAEPWKVGIRNPFDPTTIVKVLSVEDRGIATSGTYIRGRHIYDPVSGSEADAIASMTVVAPNVYEADRLATAAFAMGCDGIGFIASLPGCDGYMVDRNGMATFTPGFARYIQS